MHDQTFTAGQVRNQIFSPAIKAVDPLAYKAGVEIPRKREAQIGSAGFNSRNGCAFHHRRKAAPHRFHLRKLRHAPLDRLAFPACPLTL